MFDQKPQTNRFEKMQNFRLLFSMILQSKVANFLSRRSQNTEFLTKNHGLTTLKKCKILDFLNRCF